MVRVPRLTRSTLARSESVVALVLAVHAALLWSQASTDLWVWSIGGFLGLLGVLSLVGLVRPTTDAVAVVRGSLAVATAVLVGEATGSLDGLFFLWFLGLAFVYPVTLSTRASAGAVGFVAASYGITVHFGTAMFPLEGALLRSGVLGAVGLVAFSLGVVLNRLVGDREDAEIRIREMQGVLDAAFDTASSGMALLDLDGAIVGANQALADFLGRTTESLVGAVWGSLIRPQERPRYTEQVAELIDGSIWSFQAESCFVLRDRRTRFGMVGMSLVADAAGRARFIFAHLTNITDRVRSEQRVRRSEAHYRNLFELAPVPLLQLDLSAAAGMVDHWRSQGITDLDAHFADADETSACVSAIDYLALNEYARRLFRAGDHAEFNAGASSGGLGPHYCDLVRRVLLGIWRREAAVETGAVLTDLSGDRHEGLVRVVIPEVEGRPEHERALLAFTDLTETLRSRSELQRAEQRLRAVMGAAAIAMFAVDRHGVLTLAEGQGLGLLGLSPGQAVGRSVFEMYRDVPGIVDSVRRALQGEALTSSVEFAGMVFEIRYSPTREEGKVTGVIAVAVDATERTRAGEKLEELVEAKGRFMATISHELRTPLTSVVGFTQQLRTRLDDLSAEEIRALVEMVGDQATEMNDLIDDLLVVNRSELGGFSVSAEPIDLWQQVEAVVSSRPVEASLSLEQDGAEAKVLGDAMRVRQVLRNLLTNADRYGGDHVTVRVVPGPETTSLFIIDDGPGVPEEERSRIFEPYHGSGTRADSVGLGLTVSRELARLMSGDLSYIYYRDHSFFELRLPTA